jgi:aspartyl-tRNA(Asn)/glutamyl-tRNA(Gln) amidotransferase subunit C
MASINDEALAHLFALSRIEEERDPERREKLKNDLSKILDHFNELQEVDTSAVEPLAGGGDALNVLRDDAAQVRDAQAHDAQRELCVKQFPESENRHLKVPPIFE